MHESSFPVKGAYSWMYIDEKKKINSIDVVLSSLQFYPLFPPYACCLSLRLYLHHRRYNRLIQSRKKGFNPLLLTLLSTQNYHAWSLKGKVIKMFP